MRENAETAVAVLATAASVELDRTVEAFAALGSRVVVVDPLERAPDGGPTRVRADRAGAMLGEDPVLVVVEGESPTPELGSAIEAGALPATGTARVVVRHVGRGWAVEPRGGAPRFGPWGIERFGFDGVARRGARRASRGVLPGALVASYGDVDAALARVDAAAACVAALLDEAHAPVGLAGAARSALGTGTRALLGRSPRGIGLGRWIGAVLLAYAEVLAYTKVLERQGRA